MPTQFNDSRYNKEKNFVAAFETLSRRVKILGTQLEDVRRKAANLPRLKEKLGKAEKENEVLKKENKVLKKNNAEFNEVYDRSEILDL